MKDKQKEELDLWQISDYIIGTIIRHGCLAKDCNGNPCFGIREDQMPQIVECFSKMIIDELRL